MRILNFCQHKSYPKTSKLSTPKIDIINKKQELKEQN